MPGTTPHRLAVIGEPTAGDRLMRLVWRVLRGDKRNQSRLPDNNFVAMFDATTHRANANSRTRRGYRPGSRLLTRLREDQATRFNHATTGGRVVQKNNRSRALDNCSPTQSSRAFIAPA